MVGGFAAGSFRDPWMYVLSYGPYDRIPTHMAVRILICSTFLTWNQAEWWIVFFLTWRRDLLLSIFSKFQTPSGRAFFWFLMLSLTNVLVKGCTVLFYCSLKPQSWTPGECNVPLTEFSTISDLALGIQISYSKNALGICLHKGVLDTPLCKQEKMLNHLCNRL